MAEYMFHPCPDLGFLQVVRFLFLGKRGIPVAIFFDSQLQLGVFLKQELVQIFPNICAVSI